MAVIDAASENMEEDRSEKPKSFLSVDDVLKVVGEFGLYQRLLDFIFFLMIMSISFHSVLMYFAALNPSWRCVENSTHCSLNSTLPSNDDRRCQMPRNAWVYAEPIPYSIVTEFDINCSRKWLSYLTTSVFFAGWCIGAIILGWMSENYGRKTVLFPSLATLLIVGFGSSFSPNVYVFTLARFIVGFSAPGVQSHAIIIMSEIVGSKWRAFAVTNVISGFSIGCVVLAILSYFVREWRNILIYSTVPFVLLGVSFRFVPESVRWLRVQGKLDRISENFQAMASWNKKNFSGEVNITPLRQQQKQQKATNVIDIFRTKVLLTRSLVQGYAVFSIGVTYYGLLLAANDLGGSIYIDFIILNLTELPANVVCLLTLNRFGRKKTILSAMLIAGAICVSIAFIPRHDGLNGMRTVFGMVGKFFINIAFNGMFTWSAEIYPTTIRSIGTGFIQFSCHSGAASAPWIAKGLSFVSRGAPFIVMGVLIIIGFFLALILPETKDQIMSECADVGEDV